MTSWPHLSESLPQLALPSEVAPYLRRSQQTVERQLRRGELPGVKVGGRWFVHVARLAEMLDGKASA